MKMKTTTIAAVATVQLASAAPPAMTTGPSARPVYGQQANKHGSYKFTDMTTVRYATPLSSSPPVTTYMPSASMEAIMPSGVHVAIELVSIQLD
jgi:hypothetical protein